MSDEPYIKIKYTQINSEDELNPSLVVFPNNHPKDDYFLQENCVDNWVLCENKNHARKDNKMLLGKYEKIEFEGKSKLNNKNKSRYILNIKLATLWLFLPRKKES